jgi:hypothetical protein
MSSKSQSGIRTKPKKAVTKKPIDRWLGLVSIAVGVIFFLLPKTPPVILLSLALVFLLIVHPVWNFWWIENSRTRRFVSLTSLAVVLALVGWVIWPKPSSQPKSYAATLLVRYASGALPFPVDPGTTAYVLQLNPNITEGLWEIKNNGQHAFDWPRDIVPRKALTAPELIYMCELTNHGDKALLDVVLVFPKRFHDLKKIGEATKTKNSDGTYSVTIPGPPRGDTSSFLDPDSGVVTTEGVLVKAINHRISIPAIAPRQKVTIYLVNQSRFISRFTFPNEATAVPAEQIERVQVALIRPRVNVVDSIPWYSLPPARYKWKGVPDAP